MTKKINLFIILNSIFLFFFSCERYPKGGFTGRASKNILGVWKLKLFEVDGIDSTDLINYNNDVGYKKISFLKNASTVSISAHKSGATMVHFIEENQKLVFGNSKIVPGTECTVYQNANYCYRSFLIPEGTYDAAWNITQLNKNQIELVLNLKKSYRLILVH